MPGIVLNGITWGHSRGITPLLAVSQRYSELNPGVEIRWEKRTLQQFADFPIEQLAGEYDLLVIDHPWVGCADATNTVLPLNEYLPRPYLDDQLENSVGNSHPSYNYNDKQWALAIDAATPAASYRKDLLEKNNCQLPETWDELIDLAKKGKVAVPAIPIDLLMNFYTFCIAHGNEPFENDMEVVEKELGVPAIETMRELYSLVDKKMFTCNPIAVAELMSTMDEYWYCPFAYCYSNYSRSGYAKNLLFYHDVVSFQKNKLRTTIGGTGLAVSSTSKNKEQAIAIALMIASPQCQSTLYVQHSGQPAHRSAWIDEHANRLTHDFFRRVLPVMDHGYTRPRYNGYLFFQDRAGIVLQKCLLENTNATTALDEMNRIYRQSLLQKRLTATV